MLKGQHERLLIAFSVDFHTLVVFRQVSRGEGVWTGVWGLLRQH